MKIIKKAYACKDPFPATNSYECVTEDGRCRMVVTGGFGPRILHLSLGDGPNILFRDDTNHVFHQGDWNLFGGHRIWTGPEEERAYSEDNALCEAVIDEQVPSLTLICHDKKQRLDKAMRITERNNRFVVTHTITNTSQFLFTGCIWALTCVEPRGTVFLPWGSLCKDWDLKKVQYWKGWAGHTSQIASTQYVETPDLFLVRPTGEEGKVGTAGYEGFIGVTVGEFTFIKKFKRDPNATYPDDNCAIECYTNKSFIELETLSPMYTMAPGQSYVHEEEWILVDKAVDPQEGAQVRALL